MRTSKIKSYLKNVTRDNLNAAMEQLEHEEIPISRQSDEYDVIDPNSGKGYPPPLLIELAYRIATGEELPDGFFKNVGEDSPHFNFLQDLGLEIQWKVEVDTEELISNIQEKAKELNQLTNEEYLFEVLSMDHPLIQTAIKEEKRWLPTDKFEPVVLLRHLVLEKLKTGENLSLVVIEEMKAQIDSKIMLEEWNLSPVYIQSVNNYPEKKRSLFHQWRDPFKILYPLFYSSREKRSIKLNLNKLGKWIGREIGLTNFHVHTVGFEGTQNYGQDEVWLALIPKEIKKGTGCVSNIF